MDTWMGTIIGAILGFLASTIPTVLDIIKASYQHRFDMNERTLRIEAAQRGVEVALASQSEELRNLTAQLSETTSLKVTWIDEFLDALRTSVRPVITYAFFGLFFWIKIAAMYHGYDVEHLSIRDTLALLWDADTSSLFAAIISYWFGARALSNASTPTTLSLSSPVSVTQVKGIVDPDTPTNVS